MGNGSTATYQVHDRISGTLATQRKEELQMEIERQQELGEYPKRFLSLGDEK